MQNTNVPVVQDTPVNWTCHLHTSGECTISLLATMYYHVIPTKKISATAARYNSFAHSDEFWELLGPIMYVAPVAYSSARNNISCWTKIKRVMTQLDAQNIRLSQYDTANDFMKKHLVVNSTGEFLKMCNAYLIRKSGTKKKQEYYSRPTFKRALLKALFPKIDMPKNGIPTNTPGWALESYDKLKVASKLRAPGEAMNGRRRANQNDIDSLVTYK